MSPVRGSFFSAVVIVISFVATLCWLLIGREDNELEKAQADRRFRTNLVLFISDLNKTFLVYTMKKAMVQNWGRISL